MTDPTPTPNPDPTPNPAPVATPPGTTPAPGEKGDPPAVTFTPEQQKVIDGLLGMARKEGKSTAEQAAADLAEKQRIQKETDEQVALGQFTEARAKIEGERDTAVTKLTDAETKLNTLITAIKPDVDAQWAALPEEVTELFTGEADDVIGKRAFMSTHKKLITALAGKAEESKNKFRTGKVPIPNGKGGEEELKSPLSAREIRGG